MKIIGKAKGKAPKAWCLMQDSKTGHYYVGWDGYWPLNGSHEAVTQKVNDLKAVATPEPVVGPKVDWPGFHPHGRSPHATPLTQQQLDDYAAYQNYQQELYAHNQWVADQNKMNVVALDYQPVFEDELRFIGYTRGRSSVTMQFEASNGQTIEFGPSGIDGLLVGIIEQTCVPVVLAGTYEKEKWNVDKQEYEYETTPRGKGIKARFKFVKKGANLYAELTED